MQNIESINHPREVISKDLYEKCIDRLTGADKLAALIDGVMANTISPRPHSFDSVMSEIRNSFDNFEPTLLEIEPFIIQPFEWPIYLDRSYRVKIDVIQIP